MEKEQLSSNTARAEKSDCSTAGQGFAKTEKNNIAPENCGKANTKGFAQVDYEDIEN